MKKIFFIIFLLFFNSIISQTRYNFFVEFDSQANVPTVTDNGNGTITLTTSSASINATFSNHVIYKFTRLAPHAISVNLQNTYSIECDDIALMTDLTTNFSSVFVMSEAYTIPSDGGQLYLPNDYSLLTSVDPDFEHKHLDMINAQQAWDITHGDPNIKIGIADSGYLLTHEEFVNKPITLVGSVTNYVSGGAHGTFVAGLAAGDTDNRKGISSIGFNSGLSLVNGLTLDVLTDLADRDNGGGATSINGSWYQGINQNGGVFSQTMENLMQDLTDQGVVMVFAAGNGPFSGYMPVGSTAEDHAKRYYYPASCKNVISVSTVGNWNEPYTTTDMYDNWKNIHRLKTPIGAIYTNGTSVTETYVFNQHNDSVDIVVPAYKLPKLGAWGNNAYWAGGLEGTSFSAPIVAGTVALMQSVNPCLKPNEIESVLKLTATNIENHPENLAYHGKLGAGSLDAGKAVKMVNDMTLPFGTVTVEDRILYRWFYKLERAPFEIKMQNNLVTQGAKLKFIARDNIEILSGDYNPNENGYIRLEINEELVADCETLARNKNLLKSNEHQKNGKMEQDKLFPNPNKGIFTVSLGHNVKSVDYIITDMLGKTIHSGKENGSIVEINLPNVPTGMYLIKLVSENHSKSFKFVKN